MKLSELFLNVNVYSGGELCNISSYLRPSTVKHSGKAAQYDIQEDSEHFIVKLNETAIDEELEMLSSQMSGLGSDISEQIDQISSQVSELGNSDNVQARVPVAIVAEGLDLNDDEDGLPSEGECGVLPGGGDGWNGDGTAICYPH